MKLDITKEKQTMFYNSLAKTRQWIDGFEAAGKSGPCDKDMLRQLQIWLKEAK